MSANYSPVLRYLNLKDLLTATGRMRPSPLVAILIGWVEPPPQCPPPPGGTAQSTSGPLCGTPAHAPGGVATTATHTTTGTHSGIKIGYSHSILMITYQVLLLHLLGMQTMMKTQIADIGTMDFEFLVSILKVYTLLCTCM